MVMYGTTALTMEIVGEPLPSSHLWSTAGPLSGTDVLAGGMATSGALTGMGQEAFGWTVLLGPYGGGI